ncbi:NAD(P)/FAD-dependent oxidoreductase [Algoriphagus halophytocola]|uniref:NADH:ubiquinone reductase (non-electrogenic) n=1 Tax=Algoriphagus halophytocola TaxID=2991499 RepID=A0ABY6MDI5_9BACT|nr:MULTISPECIES: NAD(P)/FAD-dependent oxidoreductase [unclassified Algoriphagus]UZD21454.1 NAD(P)/FAD-dependent oxidoreductase [Algoriphagus sp. TR-M5]WBL42666.1 NAD(P)/FAD-dependent oxidoreductase [Algoriphagus sp. TR-M9]
MTDHSSTVLPNIPKSNYPKVVIIGAGFAGLKLARDLMNKPFQVILLDKNNYHQFQPLFYQVATAGLEPSAISFPLRKVFHKSTNVIFRMAEVDYFDQKIKRVYTNVGYLDYDHLVLAMGADTNYFGSKSIEAAASPMKSVSEALFIRNKIISNYERAINIEKAEDRKALMNVVIVGGGPTGVELAGAMADLRNNVLPKDYPELNFHNMKIVLIEAGPTLLAPMSKEAKDSALKYLLKLGVEVMLDTMVKNYDGKEVTLEGKAPIETHTLLWAAGIKPVQIGGLKDQHFAPNGRILVNEQSEIVDCPEVYALGDVSLMKTEDYPNGHPQVAQVALQQAKNLGFNLIQKQKGKGTKPFAYKDLGSMATVGRKLAVVDLPFIKFQGVMAWLTWLFVHLMAILGVKNKLFIFLDWSWNYLSFDPSLRLLIKPKIAKGKDPQELMEEQ